MTYFTKLCYLVLILFFHSSSVSQIVEQSQSLNLGTVAVIDNDIVATIAVSKDGLVRTSGGVRVLVLGNPAIFTVASFDSNRRLFISIQATQSVTQTSAFSPEQFTVQSYDTDDFITTDDIGGGEFSVGAIFATSGSSSENFRDTTFSANYTVTVNY